MKTDWYLDWKKKCWPCLVVYGVQNADPVYWCMEFKMLTLISGVWSSSEPRNSAQIKNPTK